MWIIFAPPPLCYRSCDTAHVSGNGNVMKFSNRNSVTDSYSRIIKIGMWVGHEKHCKGNTLKVKRSKVKITRSYDVVAHKNRIYIP